MCSYRSPQDPIFYAHHGFVDRLWWTWQKNKDVWNEGPQDLTLESTLCPSDRNQASDWLDSRALPGTRWNGQVSITYKTRADMRADMAEALLETSHEVASVVKASVQAESKLQLAAKFQQSVGIIPECCHQGLAKIGVKTARAIIRQYPGGEDLCAVNYHNTELEANKEWCLLGHGTGDAPCEEDCEEDAKKIIREKEREDEHEVLHCEVEQPEPEERRLCMALYPSYTCADNMFDKCVEHKIMHDGSFDGETGLCIPEYIEQMVRDYVQAKQNGLACASESLLEESTIEKLMQAM